MRKHPPPIQEPSKVEAVPPVCAAQRRSVTKFAVQTHNKPVVSDQYTERYIASISQMLIMEKRKAAWEQLLRDELCAHRGDLLDHLEDFIILPTEKRMPSELDDALLHNKAVLPSEERKILSDALSVQAILQDAPRALKEVQTAEFLNVTVNTNHGTIVVDCPKSITCARLDTLCSYSKNPCPRLAKQYTQQCEALLIGSECMCPHEQFEIYDGLRIRCIETYRLLKS